MTSIVYNVLSFKLFQKLFLKLHPVDHRALYYHILSDNEIKHDYYYSKVHSLSLMKKQIQWLLSLGFIPVSLDDFLSDRNSYAHRRTFSITTDDGYAENYSVIAPYLEKEKIPCTIFLCSKVIDNKEFLPKDRLIYIRNKRPLQEVEKALLSVLEGLKLPTFSKKSMKGDLFSEIPEDKLEAVTLLLWETLNMPDEKLILDELKPYLTKAQIIELLDRGFTIGAHTKTHLDLTKLDEVMIEDEVVGSVEDLSDMFGVPIRYFSYPYGKCIYPQLEKQMLTKSGVRLFFSTQYQLENNVDYSCWGRDRMEHPFKKSQAWFLVVPLLRKAMKALKRDTPIERIRLFLQQEVL